MNRLWAVLLFMGGLWAVEARRAPVFSSWRTEHFELAASKELSEEMPRMAALAEMSYDSLVVFYGYSLKAGERFRLVLLNEDDYSNGYAIGFAGWVAVYMTPADFSLRGSPGWHANVLAHEISHLFSLRKLGYTHSYLGHSFQGRFATQRINTQVEMGSYPAGLESWLAEGLAQLGAEACGVDRWDAIRDALEREAYFRGDLPRLSALKVFHQDSRYSELFYNQGYSFMRWVRAQLHASQWQRLLNEAQESTLQKAIAHTLQKDFSTCVDDWRLDRAKRHDAVSQKLSDWPLPALLESPTGDFELNGWRVRSQSGDWYLSSRNNAQGEFRLYGPNGNLVEKNPLGFLWASSSGDRVLYGAQNKDWNHHIRNQLWEVRAPDWKPQPVPGAERVQGACYSGSNLWVIRQQKGRNRILFLQNGNWFPLQGWPNGFEPMEIACSDSRVVVSATHGRGRGLYLVQQMGQNMEWEPLVGDSIEDARHPYLKGDSLYYSSDRSGSHQIYVFSFTSQENRVLTAERGGAFYPSWLGNALHYSAFRGNAWLPVRWTQSPVQEVYIPAESRVAPPILRLNSVALESRVRDANRISYLGWYTSSAFSLAPQQRFDTIASTERVVNWSITTGRVWADPSLTNELQLYGGGLGMVNSSFIDDEPGFVLGGAWSNHTFSPDLSLQIQMVMLPIRNRVWDELDEEMTLTIDNVWLTGTVLDAMVWQPLSNPFSLISQFSLSSSGIYLEGGAATLQQGMLVRTNLMYESYEYGVRHPLQGLVAQGGGGYQWWGSWLPVFNGATTLYANGFRKVYFSLGGAFQTLYFDHTESIEDEPVVGWQWAMQGNASLDIPLPWSVWGASLSSSISQSWTALEWHLGYEASIADLPFSQAQESQGISKSTYSLLHSMASFQKSRALRSWSAQDFWHRSDRNHYLESSLRLETLTFANTLGMWELGVRFPPPQPKDWTIFLSLQL